MLSQGVVARESWRIDLMTRMKATWTMMGAVVDPPPLQSISMAARQ